MRRGAAFLFAIVGIVLLARGPSAATAATTGATVLISATPAGLPGEAYSVSPSISADGRYVAFHSQATDLIADDNNGDPDVFIHDRLTGETELVSVASSGEQADNYSANGVISPDGRYVVFESKAGNIDPVNIYPLFNIYIRDRQAGTTTVIALSPAGLPPNQETRNPDISADGRYVVYVSAASNLVPADDNNASDIFLHDRQTGSTGLISSALSGGIANGDSTDPRLSSNGRYIVYSSSANDLTPGDQNSANDVFLHDRQMGTTRLLSVSMNGEQGNANSEATAIAPGGRFVVFSSIASNLTPGDTNGVADYFVVDLLTGALERISVSSSGEQGNAAVTSGASISADGRFVTFASSASNLVPGDTNQATDVFVRDRLADTTTRISVDSAGAQAIGYSQEPVISADGSFVAFHSNAGNLFPGDNNYANDIFVHDRRAESTYSAAGRITDAGGAPMSGLAVCTQDNQCVMTDETGAYVFADLITGSYIFTPTSPLHAFSPTSWAVPLPPDGVGLDFTATLRHYAVSGRVVDYPTGRPIPGVALSAAGLTTQTGSDGTYSLSGLPAGEYTLTPDKTGWVFSPASRAVVGPPDVAGVEFVGREIATSPIKLVSYGNPSVSANGDSYLLAISFNSRYHLFYSRATNVMNGLAPGEDGVLIRYDSELGRRVGVGWRAAPEVGADKVVGVAEPGGDMSADGRYVVFVSGEAITPGDANGADDVFLYDVTIGSTTRLTRPDGVGFDHGAHSPRLSADGRYVLFLSSSTNVVTGATWSEDLYLYERATGAISRVTARQSAGGADAITSAVLSDDGRYVAFTSLATNFAPGVVADGLSHLYLYDRIGGGYTPIGRGDALAQATDITPDGQYVAVVFAGDMPDGGPTPPQVYVFIRATGVFALSSATPDGFPGNAPSGGGVLTDDSQAIAYWSEATDLRPGTPATAQKRLYVTEVDFGSETVRRLDVGLFGEDADGGLIGEPARLAFTGDGRTIGFTSAAGNLAVHDQNNHSDAFSYLLDLHGDQDFDGQTDATEDSAPHDGDGNSDGVPDSEQIHITSLPLDDDSYLTLAMFPGQRFVDVALVDCPAPGAPAGVTFPIGCLRFIIHGLIDGEPMAVELLFEDGVSGDTYYQYGPTPGNPAAHWYEFAYDSATGVDVQPDKIVLHLVDGQRGDGDLTANGDIVVFGGPAIKPPPAEPEIAVSPSAKVTFGGVTYEDEDILAYDVTGGAWRILFDGSDVGLSKNLAAFTFLPNGDLLLTFAANQVVPGLGTFTAWDVARFHPTQLGATTAGTFAWYVDGSDVGLTTAAEKIDALDVLGDGRILISPGGVAAVPGLPKQQDEDVLALTPTATGLTTTGTWALYFNGTAVTGLAAEDINGFWVDEATGDRYFTLLGAFKLGSLTGPADKSIIKLPAGSATPSLLTWTVPAFKVDGFEILP